MKNYIKRIFTLILFFISVFVLGSITTIIEVNASTYYDSITATSGETLKSQLRSLITTTHTKITSYDDCKNPEIVEKTDGDPNNPGNIILFWSGLSIDSAWDGGDTWNREHVWPQSKGWFGTSGAGSDLHHIRPSDSSVNSTHNNYPYGVVTNGNSVKCSKYNNYYVTDCLQGNSTFEPCDERKGDTARIIFYMLTRYSSSDSYPITNVASSMDLLLEWNEADPVDVLEENRNNAVASIQGNRNPFIDNSDYANMIWGDGASSGDSSGEDGSTGGGTTNTPDEGNPDNSGAWELVTSVNALEVNDEIIIVAKDFNYALSTYQANNYRGQAIITKNDNVIETISEDVQVLTLGTIGSNYTLSTGSGYLYASGTGTSNYMNTKNDTLDLDAQWSISIDSNGTATIQAQGDAPRNIIYYNSGNTRFSCYATTSNQKPVCIYEYIKEEQVVVPETATDKFSKLSTKTSLSFSYNYSNKVSIVTENKYQLVTNVSDLNIDDEIIIVAKDSNYALSTIQASNYREQTEITKNNNMIDVISDKVQVLTLGMIGSNYTLSTGSGYLYASGTGTSNYMNTKNDTSDLDAQWSISIDSKGTATIQAQGDAPRNIIYYNSGNTRFSCYATSSNQKDVCIYKKVDVQTETSEIEYSVNSLGIRYGNMISVELYDELVASGTKVKFGVAALKASTLTTEGTTLEDYIGTRHYYECEPVRVNEYGEADENGEYYQFALVIKGIPMSDIDNDITAACYVSIDGEVTLMNETTNSVRSTAEIYLLNNDISSEYLDILNYIYNY